MSKASNVRRNFMDLVYPGLPIRILAALDKFRRHYCTQHDLALVFTLSVSEPPNRRLLDVPFCRVARDQPRGGLPQRRLVSYNEDRAFVARPARSCENGLI